MKIFNLKNQRGFTTFSSHERGFTLIEMLASIIVLVAVGSIIAGIITSSLVGTSKTNTIENVRQNGNYTLRQMAKNIEFAQVFNGVSDTGDVYADSCLHVSPTPTPDIKFIKVTSSDGSEIIYNCDGSTLTISIPDGMTTPTPTPLIGQSSLSLMECSLVCTQSKSTDTPLIRIRFSLGPVSSGGFVETSSPPILFETSVAVRNYR